MVLLDFFYFSMTEVQFSVELLLDCRLFVLTLFCFAVRVWE